MFYSSPDGEEGFPGKLDTIVTFRLVANSFKVRGDFFTEARLFPR